jgi:hypothetical protein
MVTGGRAELVRRRESYDDLLAHELMPDHGPASSNATRPARSSAT